MKSKSKQVFLLWAQEKLEQARICLWSNLKVCLYLGALSNNKMKKVSKDLKSRLKKWTLQCFALSMRTKVIQVARVCMSNLSLIKQALCFGLDTFTKKLLRAKWSRRSGKSMTLAARSKGSTKDWCHNRLHLSTLEKLDESDKEKNLPEIDDPMKDGNGLHKNFRKLEIKKNWEKNCKFISQRSSWD